MAQGSSAYHPAFQLQSSQHSLLSPWQHFLCRQGHRGLRPLVSPPHLPTPSPGTGSVLGLRLGSEPLAPRVPKATTLRLRTPRLSLTAGYCSLAPASPGSGPGPREGGAACQAEGHDWQVNPSRPAPRAGQASRAARQRCDPYELVERRLKTEPPEGSPCWPLAYTGLAANSGFPNRSQVWARCPGRKWGAGPAKGRGGGGIPGPLLPPPTLFPGLGPRSPSRTLSLPPPEFGAPWPTATSPPRALC